MEVSLDYKTKGSGKRVISRPVRFLYLTWPMQRDRRGLFVVAWMRFDGRRVDCGGTAVEGGTLDFGLPAGNARVQPGLYGLCLFGDGWRRAAWFAKRRKRIRALLPPVVRLAFDRWYGP